jgi:hypothetical protein
LADTSLVSRIHATADFSAHQHSGDGTANRGNSAAATTAHLISEQSAGDATQHLPDCLAVAVAHLRLLQEWTGGSPGQALPGLATGVGLEPSAPASHAPQNPKSDAADHK